MSHLTHILIAEVYDSGRPQRFDVVSEDDPDLPRRLRGHWVVVDYVPSYYTPERAWDEHTRTLPDGTVVWK